MLQAHRQNRKMNSKLQRVEQILHWWKHPVTDENLNSNKRWKAHLLVINQFSKSILIDGDYNICLNKLLHIVSLKDFAFVLQKQQWTCFSLNLVQQWN